LGLSPPKRRGDGLPPVSVRGIAARGGLSPSPVMCRRCTIAADA
jgi:hypothetical protein